MVHRCVFLLLLVFLPRQFATAENLVGKVVAITDGDTVKILVDKTQHKIRLEGIDTPERKQPYGTKAKQHLSGLIFGKTVTAKVLNKDRYGRLVADIVLDGTSINLQMVVDGFAWRYPQYDKDGTYTAAEQEARKAGSGLWADSEPVPPWQWRRQKRK